MLQQRSEALRLGLGDALLVIDVQNDFLPHGCLPVPEGDRVIAPLNRYLGAFSRRGLAVIVTRDWHPSGHCSFRERGGPWPAHCLAGSAGAAFPESLALPEQYDLIDKAVQPEREDLSGFGTEALPACLERRGVDRLFVAGLATEYCVLETVLDGLGHGYAVVVLVDAIEALERQAGDAERAMERMADAGARFTTFDQLGA